MIGHQQHPPGGHPSRQPRWPGDQAAYQPGYGPGAVPPAGPRRSPPNRRRGLVLTLATAVLLLIGVGTTYGVMGWPEDGETPQAPLAVEEDAGPQGPLSVAWTLPWAADGSGSSGGGEDGTREMWPGDGTVVRVQPDGVVAFRVADGVVAWNTPSPGSTTICTASPSTADGIGVFAYRGGSVCDRLGGIDIKTGKVVFDVAIEAEAVDDHPTVVATTGAAVVHTGGQVLVYRLRDGSLRWKKDPPRLTCVLDRITASADRVFVSQACVEDGGFTGADTVVALDLATGRETWSAPTGGTVQGFLSASPLVAAVYRRQDDEDGPPEPDDSVFLVLDATGAVTATLPKMENGRTVNDGRTSRGELFDEIFVAHVHDNVLYLTADNSPGSGGSVVALDLATGTRRWESTGIEYIPEILGVDDKGVMVLEKLVHYARLTRVDLTTGTATVLSDGEFQSGELPSGFARLLMQGGTVVIALHERGLDPKEQALTALRAS